MTYENINFKKDHFVVRDGYFYFIDEESNILYEKASDGVTTFTYPMIAMVGTNEVECLEYDGHFFWSLQEGPTDQDIVIKKWFIENYVVHLEETIEFIHDADHSFDVDTFSLEYYNTTLSANVLIDDSSIYLSEFSEFIVPGTVITIGPNDDEKYEDVTVTGTLDDGALGLNFFIKNNYTIDTPVYFTTNLWLVNHYAYSEANAGAIYQIKLPQNEIVSITEDSDFDLISSSCFYTDIENKYMLITIGTNLRFVNLVTLVVDKTMTMDNIEANQSTIHPVHALQLDGETLYRLQYHATYFNNDYHYSTANYQVSPMRPFVDSVSIDVWPKILPANGINVAEVTAIVNDQFAHPIQIKPVEFRDDDSVGFMTIQNTYTNLAGRATSYYKAGIVPRSVLIMVMATQYD